MLEDLDITSENVYNIDETGVKLSKLRSIEVLVAANVNALPAARAVIVSLAIHVS